MELFNLALLGKHGWRFMVNPDSLCARVMKGRYFPNSNFMQATVPQSASPIWRAIVAEREALRSGMIMRVGDGRSISIWDDKWIPGTIRMSPMLRPTNTSLQSARTH